MATKHKRKQESFVSRPDHPPPLAFEAAPPPPEPEVQAAAPPPPQISLFKDGQGSQSGKVTPGSSIAVQSETITAAQTQVLTYQAQNAVDRQALNDMADRVRNANDAILAQKGTAVAK